MASNPRRKIVIVGGGFGGVYAALELDKWLFRFPDVDVTIVNRDNFFLFTPMLHEVAASDLDITHIVNPVRKLVVERRLLRRRRREDRPRRAHGDGLARATATRTSCPTTT